MLAKTKKKEHPQNRIYASIAGEKTDKKGGKFWKFSNSINDKQEKEAELLLYGVIGEDGLWSDVTAKQFSDELKEVEDAKTIRVRINSPGGDVFAGQAIYSMLKRCKAEVVGYVDGLAASIASLVLMACDKVIMPKNSMLMIHKPWTATAGNANDMAKTIETLNKVEEAMLTAYVDKTGLAEDEIKELLAAETWLSASDAVAKGFADEIEETEVSACINGDTLEINGQKINIKNYKKFNAEWYNKTESRPAGEGKPANSVPTVININVVTNGNKKGKKTMDLEKLCAACGLDYAALVKAGMDNEQIKAMISAAMKAQDGDGDGNGEDAKDQVKAEKERVQNIIKLGEEYKAQEKAMQFVKDGKSVEDFKNELIKGLSVKDSNPVANDVKSSFGIGMSVEEARNFSFVKLLNAMANPTDAGAQKAAEKELEYCSKAADKYGVKNKGIIIPAEALVTPLAPKNAINTTVGAPLIPTTLEMGSFIDLLRNKCVILQVARQLNGLVGNIDIPRQTAGATGYWVGEDTAPTSSNATFDTLQLRMKTVAGNTYVTRNMLKQTTLDMEAFVREDLATALALALDKAALYGTGSNNQPLGLSGTTGVNSVNFATANAPTYAELVQMETEIGLDNAAVDSMAYIINAGTKGHCKTTQKFSGTNGAPIWEDGNQINGYKALVTNQVNTGDVFLGNWSDFIVGLFGGLEILVDPYSYSNKGAIQVTGFQDVDFGARHAESFCYGKHTA
jgi:HK97 family phage major capsid protein/ATP-dependent Clp endopeptidase proteolytic subunit ClpP